MFEAVTAALVVAAAVLLVVAGLAKLRTPGPAASMIVGFLPGLRLRRARLVARTTGVVELGSGAAVLIAGGRVAAAFLLACYLLLAAVAIRLALGPQRTACGCFGSADGEVGAAHVVVDLCAAAVCVAALIVPGSGIVALFDAGTLHGITLIAQAVLLSALAYLSITALPALAAARRNLEARA